MNEDGSVYHLALKKEEVSPLIITVGDPGRVSSISRHFDEVELRKKKREFVTHTGLLAGKRISVISTGIGTDNIDVVFNELHALFNLDLRTGKPLKKQTSLQFIRIGTSGSISPDIPVDSVLMSDSALGFDGLLHFYKHGISQDAVQQLFKDHPALKVLPLPYITHGDVDAIASMKGIYDYTGVTVTAPGFYAPQGRSVTADPAVPNLLEELSQSKIEGKPLTNIEMETSGIYGLSEILGHSAVSLSAILANRITGEFSKDPDGMVDKLILKVLDYLSERY